MQVKRTRGVHCDVPPDVATHSHEEAETLIPLHVLESLRTNTMKQSDVHLGDTDVLLLLIDLVAHNLHGVMNMVNFVRNGKNSRDAKDVIDIIGRVHEIGASKAKGLIGLHNFSGADRGVSLLGYQKRSG